MEVNSTEQDWVPINTGPVPAATARSIRGMADLRAERWPWSDDLDAVRAAPDYHTVLYEDERVRVLDGVVRPGQTVPVHTHRWGGVLYILGSSDFVRRDPEGTVLKDTRVSGPAPVVGVASWGGPLTPHSLENVGAEVFHTLTVEMKDTGADAPG